MVTSLLRVPKVLLAQGDDHLVNQWVSEPRDLYPWSGSRDISLAINHASLLPACRGPDTDHGARISFISRIRTIPGQLILGHLDRDGVNVESLRPIDSRCSRTGNEMQILERSQVGKVEDRAKVHVESLGPLPGENNFAAREFVNSLSSKRIEAYQYSILLFLQKLNL